MGIIAKIYEAGAGFADMILPEECCACGDSEVSANKLCLKCNREILDIVTVGYCPRCGAQIGPNIPISLDGCGRCGKVLPVFEQVFRIGSYRPPLSVIIRNFKYRRKFSVVKHLAGMLGEHILQGCDDDFDVIIPIPMYWSRRFVRGYDHSYVLAKYLGRKLDVPICRELVRIKNTPQQVNLSRTARLRNIRGAFAVRKTARLEGASVLLVDDVTTTGATADEAARILKKAGARRVKLAVIAKSEPPAAYGEMDKAYKRPGLG